MAYQLQLQENEEGDSVFQGKYLILPQCKKSLNNVCDISHNFLGTLSGSTALSMTVLYDH